MTEYTFDSVSVVDIEINPSKQLDVDISFTKEKFGQLLLNSSNKEQNIDITAIIDKLEQKLNETPFLIHIGYIYNLPKDIILFTEKDYTDYNNNSNCATYYKNYKFNILDKYKHDLSGDTDWYFLCRIKVTITS